MTAQIIQVMFYPLQRILALLFSLEIDTMTVGSLILSAIIISIVIRLLLGMLSKGITISDSETERVNDSRGLSDISSAKRDADERIYNKYYG